MNRLKGLWRNRFTRMLAIPTIMMMMLSVVGMPTQSLAAQAAPAGTGSCTLGPRETSNTLFTSSSTTRTSLATIPTSHPTLSKCRTC